MNRWRKTDNASPIARPAVPADRPALAALLANTWRRFGALAVEEQLALLHNGASVFAFDHYDPAGFLGLSLRAPAGEPAERWADVTMLAVAAGRGAGYTVRLMLETALGALRPYGATGLVCVAADRWVHQALAEADFAEIDQVISYTRPAGKTLPSARPEAARQRPGGAPETEAILALNAAAFTPLWRYDAQTTIGWLLTAEHAALAELAGRPVGFALTTKAIPGEYAQLMRVATHPEARMRGIGRQLVVDAIRFVQESGAPGLTLNTQASNFVSRNLYESLGFHLTGAPVAVMVYRT
jgi:ribosomal protein S18 acetylase RimI-like enzyme